MESNQIKHPLLSVVVTTMNRQSFLRKNLVDITTRLTEIGVSWEIIVAVDFLDTVSMNMQQEFTKRVHFVQSSKSGASANRNNALKICTGKLILFLQDDIFLQNGCLEKHLELHHKFPQANFILQGLVQYDPKITTEFMLWLDKGLQNNFKNLVSGFFKGQTRWEAANSSVKNSFIKNLRFNEIYEVFENLDFELKLRRIGGEFYFETSAIAFHDHLVNPNDYRNRMVKIGIFEYHFWISKKFYSSLLKNYVAKPVPKWSRWIYLMIENFLSKNHLQKYLLLKELYWHIKMENFKIKGIKEGESSRNETPN